MSMLKQKFKTKERANGSKSYSLEFKDHSRTKQSEKRSCDLDYIINKYQKTGLAPIHKDARYADFATVPDFQEAQNIMVKAREQFEALPAKLRKRFHHNPSEFLEFVANENNLDEMVKLGIVEKVHDDGRDVSEEPKKPEMPEIINDGKGEK
jgi:phage internal scaffolding protein